MSESKEIIEKLNLQPHTEGGYFSEVYRSNEVISNANLPNRYEGERSFSTSIYFLLDGEQKSYLHKLKSDETWHFYLGTALLLHVITQDGDYYSCKLGNRINKEEVLQHTIPHGCWFGAEVVDQSSFSLIGCTVAPGFEFDDFQLGKRSDLLFKFPQHQNLIDYLSVQ